MYTQNRLELKESLNDLQTNLIDLDCYNNMITKLGNLPNNKTILSPTDEVQRRIKNCIQNGHTYLDISRMELKELPNNLPTELTTLNCSNNLITKLENLPDNLTYFFCHNNKITKLENLPINLIHLRCNDNKYLHISEINAQKYDLEETPNYENYISKIQKLWKKKHILKISKILKSQTSHKFFDIPDLHKLVTNYL
jgi:hypothetical protein